MFSVSESGKGTVMPNIYQFQSGAMVAAQVGTKKAAQKIAKQAKKNLDKMSSRSMDARRTGTPLKDGIGYKKKGDSWIVYSKPVPSGYGQMKMPAAVEFGRKPLPYRPNRPYIFRQKPGVGPRPYASGTDPKPYFREAIKDAKDTTMEEINKSILGMIPT